MKLNAIYLMCALTASGCNSSYTENVEGTYFKTSTGEWYVLKHQFGDLYAPSKIDVEGMKKTLADIGAK